MCKMQKFTSESKTNKHTFLKAGRRIVLKNTEAILHFSHYDNLPHQHPYEITACTAMWENVVTNVFFQKNIALLKICCCQLFLLTF